MSNNLNGTEQKGLENSIFQSNRISQAVESARSILKLAKDGILRLEFAKDQKLISRTLYWLNRDKDLDLKNYTYFALGGALGTWRKSGKGMSAQYEAIEESDLEEMTNSNTISMDQILSKIHSQEA